MKHFTKDEIDFLESSNAIEGVYDMDSLGQAKKAWEYISKQKSLTIEIILNTHDILMENFKHLEPTDKGFFRRCEVRIGGRYGLNWVKVPEATKAWMRMVNKSIKLTNLNLVDIQFHHIEFEKIHPFVDGNGRIGRILMNWERIQLRYPILVIHEGEEQLEYYKWFK